MNEKDVLKWKEEQWKLYASETRRDKTLYFWLNFSGAYQVLLASETLYKGSQITHAISAWESA